MSSIDALLGVGTAQYSGNEAAVGGAREDGADFAAMLAAALRDGTERIGVSAGAGVPGGMSGFMPVQMQAQAQAQGLEQAILDAVSSGQASDAQIALLMLCMMMQSDQDGDFSMMMQAMASMLTQINSDTDALRGAVMSSEYDPFVLDEIDRGVFNTRLPDGAWTGRVVLPTEVWRPATPAITSAEGARSPEAYRAVIDQFRVETAERYKPFRDGYTYCNIFVWDVTSAMGAEIPHYTDPESGKPRYYPDIKGAQTLGAIATDEWLGNFGSRYGWQEVDAATAQQYANEGKPAVTTAGSLGHVQIVCPSRDGALDPVRGATIAQAGRIVTNYTHLSSTYSTGGQKSVRYWAHE